MALTAAQLAAIPVFDYNQQAPQQMQSGYSYAGMNAYIPFTIVWSPYLTALPAPVRKAGIKFDFSNRALYPQLDRIRSVMIDGANDRSDQYTWIRFPDSGYSAYNGLQGFAILPVFTNDFKFIVYSNATVGDLNGRQTQGAIMNYAASGVNVGPLNMQIP